MPSPFPGMDPYLEDREIWSGVHARLIADIQEVLNRSLRPKYVVRVEERVYVSDEEDPGRVLFVPDAQVLLGRKRLKEAPATIATPAPASVITAPRPVEVAELLDEEVRERYLTVARVEGRRVVTIIELLSPTNKVPGSRGRRSYLRKRRKTLRSGPQLVELDLLRQGEPPLPRDGPLAGADYSCVAYRENRSPRVVGWPIHLSERLPIIGVPLRGKDGDAPLDLQAVFQTTYERGGYEDVDYSRKPDPPLTAEQAAWADALLKEKGLRPQAEAGS